MKRIAMSLVISFFVIALLCGAVVYNNKLYNNTMHTIVFDHSVVDGMDDGTIRARITMRGHDKNENSSWYYTMEGNSADHYVGAIYELTLTNLTEHKIEDWSATIYFPTDMLLAEGWNGDFEVHQYADAQEQVYTFVDSQFSTDGLTLDYISGQNVLLMPMHKGDYFNYEPSRLMMEVPIGGSDLQEEDYATKTIGFITYTKNITTETVLPFARGNVKYRLQRSITDEPIFYVCVALFWIWMVMLVVTIVMHINMRKMEKEKQVIEEMVRKFELDDLTNVYSRRAFFHYADELLVNGGKEYGVAIVDVDNYKIMNNKYGDSLCHDFLIYLADYLKGQFKDGYVGRFSRSKFSVIYEVTGGEIDPNVFISSEMVARSPMPNLVLKVGIYRRTEDGISIRRCCDRVSIALSKIQGVYGQNVCYYEDEYENAIIDEHQIMEHVEEALHQHQFKVYYQPKTLTENGKIRGSEALVRWIHPVHGFMNPGQFIPVFEENGFITRMDAFVFEKVCSDMKRWKEEGKSVVPVSINISRKDFYEKNWLEERVEFAKKCEINPSMLHMEITESLYAEDMEMIHDKVKWLREQGYQIELDDFGSGYSSLGMLTKLQFDMLKLDISFIRNMDEEGIVLESIIQLAHRLHLKTIAEGVETKAEYEVVKRLGCDYIQGYYFSKPLPHDEYEEYVKKHS